MPILLPLIAPIQPLPLLEAAIPPWAMDEAAPPIQDTFLMRLEEQPLVQATLQQILNPASLFHRVREVVTQEPFIAFIGLKLLFTKSSFTVLMGTVDKSPDYPVLAEEARRGNRAAVQQIKKAVSSDPHLAIPWLSELADDGLLEAWEALFEVMDFGTPDVQETASSYLKDLSPTEIIAPIRSIEDPNDTHVMAVLRIFERMALKFSHGGVLQELEGISNPRAGTVLRGLANKNHPGGREAHQRWLDRFRPPSPSQGITSIKPPRRDSTEHGFPIHRPPKPGSGK